MSPAEMSLAAAIRRALDEFEVAATPPPDLQERLQAAVEALRPLTPREKSGMVGRLVQAAGQAGSDPLWIVRAVMEETTFDNTVDSLLRLLVAQDRPDVANLLSTRRAELVAVCEARAMTMMGQKVAGDGPRAEPTRPAWEGMLERLLNDLGLPGSRKMWSGR